MCSSRGLDRFTLRPRFFYVPSPPTGLCRASTALSARSDSSRQSGSLPRPIIVYTTRVDHARSLAQRLVDRGYSRVASFTGDTDGDERLRIIHDFAGASPSGERARTAVDIVIATSAFGLGIDNANVRTVVHLCVPERIDRYYQEVGRGGRDGNAALSLLMHTPDDLAIAERLAFRTTLRPETALERWKAMLLDPRTKGSDGTLQLSLRARWSRIEADSGANEAWNERALSLLARARLIELVHDSPPRKASDEDEDAWEQRRQAAFEAYFSSRVVRVIGDVEAALTSEHVDEIRSLTQQADRRALDLMKRALRRGDRRLRHTLRRGLSHRQG